MPRSPRAHLTLRESVGSVVESLEGRCLLTGAAASAAVPWGGDTASATTSSSSGYTPADVSIYAGAPGYEEGQQPGWFRVHRDYGFSCGSGCGCGGGIDSSLTVYYEFDAEDSTATQADDFYPLDGSVTFQPGESDAYFQFQVNDDHVVEDTESLRVNLLPGSDYDLDPYYWYSTNYIYDNEPTVSISATDTADEQGATTGKFTITRTTEMYAALDVDLLIGGTASPETDYTLTDADTGEPIAGSVTIPEGEYSTDVIVTPVDDSTREWTEFVTATLAPGDPPAFRVGQSSASVQIVDNDRADIDFEDVVDGYETNPGQPIDVNGDRKAVTLNVPTDAKAGATVTLTVDYPNDVAIYDSPTGGSALIGAGQPDHITWDAGSAPSVVYAQAVVGGDAVPMHLFAEDAPATEPSTPPTTRPSSSYADGTGLPMKIVLSNANRQRQGDDFWWFNGERPQNYRTQDLMIIQGAMTGLQGSITWDVAMNTDLIDLKDPANGAQAKHFVKGHNDNSMGVITISYSSEGEAGEETQVQATLTDPGLQGVVLKSDPFKVYAPQRTIVVGNPVDTPWGQGFKTVYTMEVVDQYGTVLPRDIEFNESFANDFARDDPNSNWAGGAPSSGMQPPNQLTDTYGTDPATFNFAQNRPAAVNPGAANFDKLVWHETQLYYVGSLQEGKGVLVDTHILQIYRGMGRQR